MYSKILILLLFFIPSFSTYSQVTIKTDSISDPGNHEARLEKEAYYPGGESAWRNFIEKSIDGSVPTNNGSSVGKYTVWVSFVIGKDGIVTDIKPLTDFGFGMEEEFVRVLKKAKKWAPATLNGNPLRSFRKQPITFFVVNKNYDITSKFKYELFSGIDNKVTVKVKHVKSKDLTLTISEGKIIPLSNGKFILQVDSPGRVLVEIYNTIKSKKIGTVSFEVKDSMDAKQQ